MATAFLLKRRRVPYTFVLGVRREPDGALGAHAWVTTGKIGLVGSEKAADFQPIFKVFWSGMRAGTRSESAAGLCE